jgi:hypothetical protein
MAISTSAMNPNSRGRQLPELSSSQNSYDSASNHKTDDLGGQQRSQTHDTCLPDPPRPPTPGPPPRPPPHPPRPPVPSPPPSPYSFVSSLRKSIVFGITSLASQPFTISFLLWTPVSCPSPVRPPTPGPRPGPLNPRPNVPTPPPSPRRQASITAPRSIIGHVHPAVHVKHVVPQSGNPVTSMPYGPKYRAAHARRAHFDACSESESTDASCAGLVAYDQALGSAVSLRKQ